MFSSLGPDIQTETHRYNDNDDDDDNNNNNKNNTFCFSSYGVWECVTINTDYDSGSSYYTSS